MRLVVSNIPRLWGASTHRLVEDFGFDIIAIVDSAFLNGLPGKAMARGHPVFKRRFRHPMSRTRPGAASVAMDSKRYRFPSAAIDQNALDPA